MTTTTASRMVFLAGGLMFAYAGLWANRTHPEEDVLARRIVAIGMFTIGLSVFADFVPEVAGPFALMLIIALAVRKQGEIGRVLGRAPAGKARATTQPAGGQTRTA